jgi:hypothetical protein
VHAVAAARVLDRRAGWGGRCGGVAGFGKDQGKSKSGDIAEVGDLGASGRGVDVDLEDTEPAGGKTVACDAAVELVGAGGEMGCNGLEGLGCDGAFLDKPCGGAPAVGAEGCPGGNDRFSEGFVDSRDGGENGGGGGVEVDEAGFGLVGGTGGEVFEDEGQFVLGDPGGDGDLGALGVLDLGGGVEEVCRVFDAGLGCADGFEVIGERGREVDGREGIGRVVQAGPATALAGKVGVEGIQGEVLGKATVEGAVLVEVFGGFEAAILVEVFAKEEGWRDAGELEEVLEGMDGGRRGGGLGGG